MAKVITPAIIIALNASFELIAMNTLRDTAPRTTAMTMRVPSNSKTNIYGNLNDIKGIREWIGEREKQSLSANAYSIDNKQFESSVNVNINDLEDDQQGIYTSAFQMLGTEAALFHDDSIVNLLKNSFEALSWDGVPFISDQHKRKDKNGKTINWSNTMGGNSANGAWYLLDSSKPIKPFIHQTRKDWQFTAITDPQSNAVANRNEYDYFVKGRFGYGYGVPQLIMGSNQDLTAANFAAAKKEMRLIKGDFDKNLRIVPDLLVVGPSNEAAAKQILLTQIGANGATNINYNDAKILVINELG